MIQVSGKKAANMKRVVLLIAMVSYANAATSDEFTPPLIDFAESIDEGDANQTSLERYSPKETQIICIAIPYAPPKAYDDILGNTAIRNTGIFPISPPNIYIIYIGGKGEVITYENIGTKLNDMYWRGISDRSTSLCGSPDNVIITFDKSADLPVTTVSMEIK